MEEVFKTVQQQIEPVEATISGRIPFWLNGSLLRNGPAKYEVGKAGYKHWFDGLGMVHSFTIQRGTVIYRSRYLESQAYLQAEKTQNIVYAEFGTAAIPDPCQSIFGRFFSHFKPPQRSDNTAVNVVNLSNRTYGNSDSPFLTEFNPETLETLTTVNAKEDFRGSIKLSSGSAHPHEESDGTVYNVMPSFGRNIRYNFVEISPQTKPRTPIEKTRRFNPFENARVVGSVKASKGLSYFHSFGITPNYFIFVEHPFKINVRGILTMRLFGRSFHDCMKWKKRLPSNFYVVSRKSGNLVATYEAEPFFSFHHINAFERGQDEVVVDICCYPNADLVNQYYLGNLRRNGDLTLGFADPEVRRYNIRLPKSGSVRRVRKLSKRNRDRDYDLIFRGLELPQINYEANNGKPYRYAYGAGPRCKGDFFNQLVKVDVITKELKSWYEEDCFPSEPVFVAAPSATAEDDGVVLSVIIGTKGKKSFLLVLDAKTFGEYARAEVDCDIAHTLHGRFRDITAPPTPPRIKEAWIPD